ncbi:hypothetical protein [Nonomuraea indica]|uniref:hypothetical protein n=1 Tax=Nonomuraea indica TaxID=1581193 RepID=UPI00118387AB|nr:hypothetical protein [Nonomuraea indica]
MRVLSAVTFSAAVLAALASPALTGAASASPAPPYNCWSNTTESGGEGGCTAGYGYARVAVVCANDFDKRTTVYGPWESVTPSGGYTSFRDCPSTYPYPVSASVQKKAL